MWRMGVPVATPITARDFLAAVSALLLREDHRFAFEEEARDFLSAQFVRSVNSGRAALFLVLQAMKRRSPRDEVVIPAYVCPSVGRAVVKAGLKPVLCDVGPGGSGLDLPSLGCVISRHTLAVVTAHLYGYAVDIAPVIELAHSSGAMVVEDAAQAFGAKWKGRSVGTLADAGVFSFAMSKVLWCMGGGLIATSDPELQRQVDHALATSGQAGFSRQAAAIAKLAVLGWLVRCRHLGPLAAVWGGVFRGKNDCDDFDAAPLPASNAAVARALLSRAVEITRIRGRNGLYFAEHLSGLDGLMLPETPPGSVFLRFPVVVRDVRVKKRLLAGLRERGVNASEMYSRPSYDALRRFAYRDSRCPRTEYLAEHMLNLPTHPYMREDDLAAAVGVFESVLHQKQLDGLALAAHGGGSAA